MNALAPSEFILNEDDSIYHLHLRPEQIAPIIITVGDPERVSEVTKYFEEIEFTVHNREFKTQTGTYNSKRITVISTGIGTDNIDIVFNELDALVNIDFNTKKIKKELTSLKIIRIGTSGAVQPSIAIDSFILSGKAIGFDALYHYYDKAEPAGDSFHEALLSHLDLPADFASPYVIDADQELASVFMKDDTFIKGITATNVGFYGPQGRVLRLRLREKDLMSKLSFFDHHGKQITNLEMETSGIYAMSKLLGHKAISLNAILANRSNGSFSQTPLETVDLLIQKTLTLIASSF
ncbi:nucleoside phosphorylase [Gangjinia marincola]|uniref:Uridine phosphorylase n=1 Tax=Gangjinia marincola TaxID=578463 RepID=A0ABN1MEW6_9FLAO